MKLYRDGFPPGIARIPLFYRQKQATFVKLFRLICILVPYVVTFLGRGGELKFPIQAPKTRYLA